MEELNAMTVVALRKYAKEKGIKLGAGLAKSEIIEKIEAAKGQTTLPIEVAASPNEEVAKATAAEPALEEKAAVKPAVDEKPALQRTAAPVQPARGNHNDIVYSTKPAWQARSNSSSRGGMRSDSIRPQVPARPAGYTPRFGPDAVEPATPPPAVSRFGPGAPAPRPAQPRVEPQRQEGDTLSAARHPYRSQPQSYEYGGGSLARQETDRDGYQPRPRKDTGYYNKELGTSNPAVPELLAAGDCGEGSGVLEVLPDGFGFLRGESLVSGSKDVYVSNAQIRRFGLRSGDHIEGKTRPQRDGEKYSALLYITKINGVSPEETREQTPFDSLTPTYPNRRISLEDPENKGDLAIRLMDLIAPIGFGQRGLIVAPPKAGKTGVLVKIANAIAHNHPDAKVLVLLLDERPEEVTELREAIDGEVLASTFDEPPENHIRLSDMMLERSQRLVEQKQDVVILVDSLTKMVRAYNAMSPQGGRSNSGGLAPSAFNKPKHFFGAARNLREGGSLTIIATALIETGSRMDDAIFEEFKNTANMELVLDREISEGRIFPAVNLQKSGTLKEELLRTPEELEGVRAIRDVLATANAKDATEQLLSMMEKTKGNSDLFTKLKDWIAIWEKSGYILQR